MTIENTMLLKSINEIHYPTPAALSVFTPEETTNYKIMVYAQSIVETWPNSVLINSEDAVEHIMSSIPEEVKALALEQCRLDALDGLI